MGALSLVMGNKNYSSWSLRPWLAMRMARLAFEEIVIPLRHESTAEAIARHSPAGKVPVLHAGDLTIWDSIAILEFIADAHPEARLWPEARAPRAVARSVAAEMHAGFVALRTHMPMNIRGARPGRGRTPEVDIDIARILAIWAECRARIGDGGPFLFGDFTNADAMFAPVVTRFNTYGVELDGVCRAYADAMLNLPAMREWFAASRAEPWSVAETDEA
jgi:glutathione S-transferase